VIPKVYSFKIQEETIEAIAEKIPQLLIGNVPPELAGLIICYDTEINSLLFDVNTYGTIWPDGYSVVVVNLDNGLTTMYSAEWE